MTENKAKKEIIEIGKYDVPKKLVDRYVRFSMMADAYLLKDKKIIDRPMSEQEISYRYTMCASEMMKIHREICRLLEIEYTSDNTDEFYIAFHREIRKLTKLKG